MKSFSYKQEAFITVWEWKGGGGRWQNKQRRRKLKVMHNIIHICFPVTKDIYGVKCNNNFRIFVSIVRKLAEQFINHNNNI